MRKKPSPRLPALLTAFLFLFAAFDLSGLRVVRAAVFSAEDVPDYDGSAAYAVINGNTPFFEESELTAVAFETYGALDAMGRCTAAFACVGIETMPTEPRGAIGSVKPTGWHTVKYDIVDGKYLFNRCHLIGYQLTAENANRQNLITGTRYLNVTGMLPFENMTADYVEETGNHVLYRVTPVFTGDDLLARGVLMEAQSVEDKGEGILFCVFCYNVQPGIAIDYKTGESRLASDPAPVTEPTTAPAEEPPAAAVIFILNVNSGVFHLESCASVAKMKEKNKRTVTSPAAALIAEGYTPCAICKPEQAETQEPVTEPETTPATEPGTTKSETTTAPAPATEPETSLPPTPVTDPAPTQMMGDVDTDGEVTSADARLVLRAAVGLEAFTAAQTALADPDADGEITSADARLVLRAAVGLERI